MVKLIETVCYVCGAPVYLENTLESLRTRHDRVVVCCDRWDITQFLDRGGVTRGARPGRGRGA
jgi:hypothetical protein